MEELGEFSRSEGALVHTGVWNYPLSAVPHFCTVSQWFYLCRKADNVGFFFPSSPQSCNPIAIFSELPDFLQHKNNCLEIA